MTLMLFPMGFLQKIIEFIVHLPIFYIMRNSSMMNKKNEYQISKKESLPFAEKTKNCTFAPRKISLFLSRAL
jgi:hypothetical protein